MDALHIRNCQRNTALIAGLVRCRKAFKPQQASCGKQQQQQRVALGEHDHLTRRDPRCHAAQSEKKDIPEDPFEHLETYNDNWLDRQFINYFASKMSQQLGDEPYKPGYEGFVDLSTKIMDGRNSKQQQQAVLGVLEALMPPNAPATFRKLFPFRQWTAEMNAAITQKFFAWLVGPLEVKEVDVQFDGKQQTWKSGVQITKCRYLEQSGCKGMCINMCKVPTQTFFTETFGLPLTMKPNFDDLSCEMVFGEAPPPLHQDEVYSEPCFAKNCTLANRDPNLPCPKIDTSRRQTLRAAKSAAE